MRCLPASLALLLLLALPGVAGAAPSAKIGMVDCDAGGVAVTLASDGGPARFVLQRGDVAVATHVQAAGPAATRIVPLKEGVPTRVTVRYGGSYVSAMVMRACAGATPQTRAAATTAADAPYPQPAVAPTAAVVPAAERPAPSPAAAPGASLPEAAGSTSAWWWLAAAAAIALAAVIGIRAPLRRRRSDRRTAGG